jgi:hypothetical protein
LFQRRNSKSHSINGLSYYKLSFFLCKTVDESLFHNLSLLLSQDVQKLHMQVGNQVMEMDRVEMESVPDSMFNVESEVLYLMNE